MTFKNFGDIPPQVLLLAQTLNDEGYSAYIVGGSVRDILLGKTPKDFDLTTDAVPSEVTRIFTEAGMRVIPTGEKFGTITVHLDDVDYEITTYRLESDYSDARRPTAVAFSKDLNEDLARRDLTINAIAFDPLTGEIVDPYGGIDDLEKGVVKAVGRPDERFHEDALRLMRAVRFATRFGFEMDEDTKKAISRNADRLRYVSAERIKKELDGILLSNKPSVGIQLLHDTGLLKIVLPEVDILTTTPQASPWHHKDAFGHTLDVVDNAPARLDVRWATLLHDIGKEKARVRDETGRDRFIGHDKISAELAEPLLRRLKFENSAIKKIVKLIFLHQAEPVKRNKMKHFIRHLGIENLEDWKAMRLADITAHKPEKVEHGMQIHTDRVKTLDDILAKNEPYDIKHLAINGTELQDAGIPKGPIVGKVLKGLLDLVVQSPEKNNKEFLKRWAINNWKRLEKEINKVNEVQVNT
jgi:tRNA nucleotidyltransferase (CCA-adding enzyme)